MSEEAGGCGGELEARVSGLGLGVNAHGSSLVGESGLESGRHIRRSSSDSGNVCSTYPLNLDSMQFCKEYRVKMQGEGGVGEGWVGVCARCGGAASVRVVRVVVCRGFRRMMRTMVMAG